MIGKKGQDKLIGGVLVSVVVFLSIILTIVPIFLGELGNLKQIGK